MRGHAVRRRRPPSRSRQEAAVAPRHNGRQSSRRALPFVATKGRASLWCARESKRSSHESEGARRGPSSHELESAGQRSCGAVGNAPSGALPLATQQGARHQKGAQTLLPRVTPGAHGRQRRRFAPCVTHGNARRAWRQRTSRLAATHVALWRQRTPRVAYGNARRALPQPPERLAATPTANETHSHSRTDTHTNTRTHAHTHSHTLTRAHTHSHTPRATRDARPDHHGLAKPRTASWSLLRRSTSLDTPCPPQTRALFNYWKFLQICVRAQMNSGAQMAKARWS